MKIALDAFGGDHAPAETIKGAVLAVNEYRGLEVILVGDEFKIRNIMNEQRINVGKITVENAAGVISVQDNPADITRSKKHCSMGRAIQLTAEGHADAVVSAGATAALVVGGTLLCKRIKGVKRPTLATIMPSVSGRYILADSGSNSECRPEMLMQFAKMGSVYAERVLGIHNPRIGLLNIGSEEEKGRELERETYGLLKSSELNFVGNMEGRDAVLGECDVLITDGFTGNVYLKTVEGMGKFMKHTLKQMFTDGMKSKLAYLGVKGSIKNVTQKLDYRETGGSPLIGSTVPIIKAHGSSDAYAFKNAIRQAAEFARGGVIKWLEKSFADSNSSD